MIVPRRSPSRASLKEWISDRLDHISVRLHIEVAPAEPTALYRRIAELDCRLLAIEAGMTEGVPEAAQNSPSALPATFS